MAHSKRKDDISNSPPRIGTVPYCNAWPLVHFLIAELPGALVSEWVPSSMRLRLMAHHLDLALMPVAELMNIPSGKIVSRCCIACRGTVRSVRIISKKPLDKIDTIALDTASRSSITLCDLILRHFFDRRPTRYRLSAKQPLDLCTSDAMVVIGDRALAYQPSDQWEHRYDLGELWLEKTGLPFVFAAWIGCSERIWQSDEIPRALEASRDRGLRQLELLLDEKERNGVPFPVSRNEVASYRNEASAYRLGAQERLGLQSFFDLALLHGLTKHRTVIEIMD